MKMYMSFMKYSKERINACVENKTDKNNHNAIYDITIKNKACQSRVKVPHNENLLCLSHFSGEKWAFTLFFFKKKYP